MDIVPNVNTMNGGLVVTDLRTNKYGWDDFGSDKFIHRNA